MIAGTAITIIGAGILTTIGADTSRVKWASYMVINCIMHGYWNGYAVALRSITGSPRVCIYSPMASIHTDFS